MAKTKKEKQEALKRLEEKISKANSLVFVGYEKVKIKDQDKIRQYFKKERGEFLVAKKNLLKRAIDNLKIGDSKNLKLEKEIGLALSYGDEIAPARIIANFTKTIENLKIKGGIFEKKLIDLEKVKFLSNLPSKQILRAQLVANLQSPVAGLVNVLQANLKSLINIFDSLAKKTT